IDQKFEYFMKLAFGLAVDAALGDGAALMFTVVAVVFEEQTVATSAIVKGALAPHVLRQSWT
ncbi:hypothetical protein M427DRAFT_55651, partial [Gonapodya prolifera JEL478]